MPANTQKNVLKPAIPACSAVQFTSYCFGSQLSVSLVSFQDEASDVCTGLLNPQPRITGEAGLYGASRSQQDNCENGDTNVPGQNNYQRGQSVDASWVCEYLLSCFTAYMLICWLDNNHYGVSLSSAMIPNARCLIQRRKGFVRFALVPLGSEDDKDAMNDPANFISISCMSNNCGGRTQGYSDPTYDYLVCPLRNSQKKGLILV